MKIKVREIIEVAEWEEESGWNYQTKINDEIKEIDEEELTKPIEWSWYSVKEEPEIYKKLDWKITIKYLEPKTWDILKKESTWESLIWEERNQ